MSVMHAYSTNYGTVDAEIVNALPSESVYCFTEISNEAKDKDIDIYVVPEQHTYVAVLTNHKPPEQHTAHCSSPCYPEEND